MKQEERVVKFIKFFMSLVCCALTTCLYAPVEKEPEKYLQPEHMKTVSNWRGAWEEFSSRGWFSSGPSHTQTDPAKRAALMEGFLERMQLPKKVSEKDLAEALDMFYKIRSYARENDVPFESGSKLEKSFKDFQGKIFMSLDSLIKSSAAEGPQRVLDLIKTFENISNLKFAIAKQAIPLLKSSRRKDAEFFKNKNLKDFYTKEQEVLEVYLGDPDLKKDDLFVQSVQERNRYLKNFLNDPAMQGKPLPEDAAFLEYDKFLTLTEFGTPRTIEAFKRMAEYRESILNLEEQAKKLGSYDAAEFKKYLGEIEKELAETGSIIIKELDDDLKRPDLKKPSKEYSDLLEQLKSVFEIAQGFSDKTSSTYTEITKKYKEIDDLIAKNDQKVYDDLSKKFDEALEKIVEDKGASLDALIKETEDNFKKNGVSNKFGENIAELLYRAQKARDVYKEVDEFDPSKITPKDLTDLYDRILDTFDYKNFISAESGSLARVKNAMEQQQKLLDKVKEKLAGLKFGTVFEYDKKTFTDPMEFGRALRQSFYRLPDTTVMSGGDLLFSDSGIEASGLVKRMKSEEGEEVQWTPEALKLAALSEIYDDLERRLSQFDLFLKDNFNPELTAPVIKYDKDTITKVLKELYPDKKLDFMLIDDQVALLQDVYKKLNEKGILNEQKTLSDMQLILKQHDRQLEKLKQPPINPLFNDLVARTLAVAKDPNPFKKAEFKAYLKKYPILNNAIGLNDIGTILRTTDRDIMIERAQLRSDFAKGQEEAYLKLNETYKDLLKKFEEAKSEKSFADLLKEVGPQAAAQIAGTVGGAVAGSAVPGLGTGVGATVGWVVGWATGKLITDNWATAQLEQGAEPYLMYYLAKKTRLQPEEREKLFGTPPSEMGKTSEEYIKTIADKLKGFNAVLSVEPNFALNKDAKKRIAGEKKKTYYDMLNVELEEMQEKTLIESSSPAVLLAARQKVRNKIETEYDNLNWLFDFSKKWDLYKKKKELGRAFDELISAEREYLEEHMKYETQLNLTVLSAGTKFAALTEKERDRVFGDQAAEKRLALIHEIDDLVASHYKHMAELRAFLDALEKERGKRATEFGEESDIIFGLYQRMLDGQIEAGNKAYKRIVEKLTEKASKIRKE